MSQHTKGPWHVGGGDTSRSNERAVIRGPRGEYIARVDPGRPEFGANRSLMAAAPELLAALKLAARVMETFGVGVDPEIHAAIAKAESAD